MAGRSQDQIHTLSERVTRLGGEPPNWGSPNDRGDVP